MKTININLIGEFAKTVKTKRLEFKEDNLDSRTRIMVIASIIGIFIVLATSFGVWLVVKNMNVAADKNLKKLKMQLTDLQTEEKILSAYTRDIKNKKKIAELKLLAREQIAQLTFPWSEVLLDLAKKIPKSIIITEMKKMAAGKAFSKLTISGIVSAKETPLTEVSFFILNINQDENSLLKEAEIKALRYEEDSKAYEFEIEAQLRKPKQG